MTPNGAYVVKYLGGMFGIVPGRWLGALEGLLESYGGNMVSLMHDVSSSGVFRATLAAGSDRDVAFDLVDRVLGDTVSSTNKTLIVDWSVARKANGLSWGEVLYTLTSVLDSITTGPWAAAGDQLRARAAYGVEATEGWAATVGNLGTLRDAYSDAIPPVYSTWHGSPVLVPLTRLADSGAALETAAASLASQSGSQNYTIGSSDAGKAILMGPGNDTVTASYADVLKPAFVSGGDGYDTLVLRADNNVDFLNAYQGVMSTLPYRGFEAIVFADSTPGVVGSFPGAKEFTFFAGPTSAVNTVFGSVDNGTVFNLGIAAGGSTTLRFSEFAPFNDITFLNAGPGAQASPPQVVDSLTFNVTAAESGSLLIPSLPAKHVTLSVDSSVGAASSFYAQFNEFGQIGGVLPNLESFTLSSDVNTWFALTAPFKSIDLSGSTGRVELALTSAGAALSDGVVDGISLSAPQGLFALNWAAPASAGKADNSFSFSGEFKAGSNIKIDYQGASKAAMPTTKIVFDSDFSEIDYYNSQPFGPLGNLKAAGSVFDVNGVQSAAVYFKGLAAQGQTIGTVNLDESFQTTTVKVDSGNGIQLLTSGLLMASTTIFINNGAGSVLDNIKNSVSTQVGAGLSEVVVDGGKILWADGNGNALLDGAIFAAGSVATNPWAWGPDFVLFETSDANLAAFSQAVQLLGFNPVVDPFL